MYTGEPFVVDGAIFKGDLYMYIEAIQCKLSLYLKKAGLASRNIVHH